MEAGFTSHLVTLFKDAPEQQEQIFELFLLSGERVLIDLILAMLRAMQPKILKLQDLALLDYVRKSMVDEVLRRHSLSSLLNSHIIA